MKINWNYIKVFFLLGFVILLFSFAKNRNKLRKISEISIDFTPGENLYITKSAVNKLLIQKIGNLNNTPKDTLDLSNLEKELESQNMVENAEVFISINSLLGVRITQRKPIARVYSDSPFYVDSNGKPMPLSTYHSARVPILVGVKKEMIAEVFPFLQKIQNSPFLKRQVVAVQRTSNGDYKLNLRNQKFYIFFGKMNHLNRKIQNLKAFYEKALKENKLDTYKKVDLQFENQVVATKF